MHKHCHEHCQEDAWRIFNLATTSPCNHMTQTSNNHGSELLLSWNLKPVKNLHIHYTYMCFSTEVHALDWGNKTISWQRNILMRKLIRAGSEDRYFPKTTFFSDGLSCQFLLEREGNEKRNWLFPFQVLCQRSPVKDILLQIKE